MSSEQGTKVGAAIAAFNSREMVRRCLEAGAGQWQLAVVLDDGSTDGTWEMLAHDFPDVMRLRADGQLWWAGGTNRAVQACLEAGCDYVLLVNPDFRLEPGAVERLTAFAESHPRSVAAAVVLDDNDPSRLWWAGSRWGRRAAGLPIFVNRLLYPAGTPVASLPARPFTTSEVYGRGVLTPAEAFRECGLFDEKTFPHYGADIDFSHRLRKAGFSMWVVPEATGLLAVDHSGLALGGGSLRTRLTRTWRYLTERKHGEALRVWYHLVRRHLPLRRALPSYTYILGVNVVARLGIRRRRAWSKP